MKEREQKQVHERPDNVKKCSNCHKDIYIKSEDTCKCSIFERGKK